MDALRTLEILITSRTPLIAIETLEEERVEQALERVARRLTIPLFVWTMTRGLRRAGALDALYDTKEPLKALRNLADLPNEGIYLMKDLYRSLGDAAVVRTLQDLARPFSRDGRAIVLSAPRVELPSELAVLASLVKLELPTEADLRALALEVYGNLARQHRLGPPPAPDILDQIAAALRGLTLFEAERALTRAVLDDLTLGPRDIEVIGGIKKEILSRDRVLDCVPVKEGLDDVGGLHGLKAWLEKRRNAFTPEAKQFGVEAPRGILLLGVQGCGKSLAAKAVAKAWGRPLLRLEPGRLFDKFVGESEKNLDLALATAERMAPCVLMIDEIEKGFASVVSSESDGGLSRRILGRLLGWMQEREAPVFLVATCNQITALPPELMRKGRFDEIFFIDLPAADERRQIFTIHLARRHRDPAGFDLPALAAAAEAFSGAEIEQAVVAALYTAFARGALLSTKHILEEIKTTKPLSVTRAEEVHDLREWALGRAVPAS
jgi:ATPase family associated with various cellular activities (AAA)